MIIVADLNIPEIESACDGLGEIRLFDSRDPATLHNLLKTADILLCRSTIAVNAELLEGTPVRFVATATSGTDHFDTAWLDAQGIVHASAAGSNARSVAEWWVASMLELHARGRIRLDGATVGIVGVGHVGTQVAEVAQALGMRCRFNDPPRAERGEKPVEWSPGGFVPKEEILSCDIVTLHVPLTREGEYPTDGFYGDREFGCMRPGALFVNAARGGVMDAAAALKWAGQGNPLALDVFPGEPRIDPALVRVADIATPHIAGHAWDGKLRGTELVCVALCEWLDAKSKGTRLRPALRDYAAAGGGTRLRPALRDYAVAGGGAEVAGRQSKTRCGEAGDSPWRAQRHRGTKAQRHEERHRADIVVDVYTEVLEVVRAAYDVRVDDAALRRANEMGPEVAAAEFARLRAEYPVRREFATAEVWASAVSDAASTMLTALGFRMD